MPQKSILIPRIKTNYGQYSCPVKNAAALLGDRWILFIMREFLYGKEKQGFNELQRYLKPISSRTLAKKIKLLQEQHLVVKKVISIKPPKGEYQLTPKGKQLKKLLQGMAQWHQSASQ